MSPAPLARCRLALALAAVLALATGCARHAQRPACPAGKLCLERGNVVEPLSLDPQSANLVEEATIIGDLMMGLTTDAADGSVAPGMASAWEVSPDGLVWTFHLRPALWSDGAPVTAQDFVYAWRRILDPKTASIYAYLLYVLRNGEAVNAGTAPPESLGAAALDARTLRLTLAHPAPYLPQLLRHQSFFPLPEHVVERFGEGWVRPGRYVSNGAYRLVSWRLGDKVRLEKNPTFFDAARVCLDRIDYVPTPDETSAERRVASGELDVNASFQSNRLQHIQAAMPGYARTHLWFTTVYLFFNQRDVPALRDVRVRRALSEAIDRDFITGKLLKAGQRSAYSFVPPGLGGYPAGPHLSWSVRPFAARQAQAQALLREAGFDARHPLKIELKTPNSGEDLLLAQAIQADWRAVGVAASIAQNEGQIAFAAYRNRDFQAGLGSWVADFADPVTFLGVFRSDTGLQNYGDYRSARYDMLLAASEREADKRRRTAIMAQAEQTLLDDEGAAPLYVSVSRNLVSPRVTGWVDNLENVHRSRWLCLRPAAVVPGPQR